MRLPVSVAASSTLLCLSISAQAAPGSWSVGIERAFGFSRVTTKTEINNVSNSVTSSQVSLFAQTIGASVGYPSPRVALDYLFPSGLSVGGALGYQSIDLNTDNDSDNDSVSAWVLEPRVGYFASVTATFGIWPRGGLTFVSYDTQAGADTSQTALSIEVPLVLNLAGNVCFTAMPYVDLGIGGGSDNVDRKITELGLQFGMNAFF